MTKKLFYNTPYETKFTATVIDCKENKNRYEITLDQTLFYPEGGGQSGDIGFLNDIEIFDTHEHQENIIHYSLKPIDIGTDVVGEINWDYRLDLMQNHTGEHMLSGVICNKYGYNNVGFHMGKDRITLDFDGKIPDEDLDGLERIVNEGIWANVPVIINSYVGSELKDIDYRSKIELNGDVRIVKVSEYDCCACCGTHVENAGEIGILKIVGSQNYKGGTRLEILCGIRAFKHYSMCFENVQKIATTFSAKEFEIFKSIEKLINDNSKLKDRVKELQIKNFENRVSEIKTKLEELEELGDTKNILLVENELNGKEISLFSQLILEGIDNDCVEIAIFSENDNGGYSFLIASNGVDVKGTFSRMKERFDCKGGGRVTSVQGSLVCGFEEFKGVFESWNYFSM